MGRAQRQLDALAECSAKPQQVQRHSVQYTAGLVQRLNDIEVMQPRQHLGDGYSRLAPRLGKSRLVPQKLLALVSAYREVKFPVRRARPVHGACLVDVVFGDA